MSELLERAKAHFKDRLEGEMGCVEIPEWGVTVYWKPMTMEQKNVIYKAFTKDGLEGLVQTLITRALDEDGHRMFKNAHRIELRKQVDPAVIDRICVAMEADEPDLDDLEKK